MNELISIDIKRAENHFDKQTFEAMKAKVKKAHRSIFGKTGQGHEFLGWHDLPETMDDELMSRIKKTAGHIREIADTLVVVGIGGSYLGAKAAVDMLSPYFKKNEDFEIIFAGHQLSSEYLVELTHLLKDRDFAINVISKSGTTTEPAIAFRALRKLMEDKYTETEIKERIIATTDKDEGALKELADKHGFETFVVPDDIGGRYSVLTPVGLLPMAVSGIDIDEVIAGAKTAMDAYRYDDESWNAAEAYAAVRNLLYDKGKNVELFINYEQKLNAFTAWWKQLFAESEGKENKGLFVSGASFSTDLHSLGQFIQQGSQIFFETILHVEKPKVDHTIEKTEDNLDKLNYLAGKTVDYVNDKAFKGTMQAHEDAGVPLIVIDVENINARSFGSLVYFFELACAISGYVLGINPFNQPGVEAYKSNMFALLGKPSNS